jgi:hypothetical protein
MKKNMGIMDRGLRALVAIALFVIYLGGYFGETFGTVVLIVASILLLTSFIAVCPAYIPFGLNTCERRTKK